MSVKEVFNAMIESIEEENITLKDTLDEEDADDIAAALTNKKGLTTYNDITVAKKEITVNGEAPENLEFDEYDNDLNVVVDGHIIPEYMIQMIRDNRIEEFKHELESRGL